jgi:hypothetical protein
MGGEFIGKRGMDGEFIVAISFFGLFSVDQGI